MVALTKRCADLKSPDTALPTDEPEYATVEDFASKVKTYGKDYGMKMEANSCYALTAVKENDNCYEEVGGVVIKMKENDAYGSCK